MCESNLSDAVYDKVTISSITGAILSADLGVFQEIAPTRGGAISWNSQIRTEMAPVILLLVIVMVCIGIVVSCSCKDVVSQNHTFDLCRQLVF